MAARMRLARLGAKKRPFYRVVVIDQRSRRNGRVADQVGTYNPIPNPAVIELDEAKVLRWLSVGVSPSETVVGLLKRTGIWAKFQAKPDGAVAPAPAEPIKAKPAPVEPAPVEPAPVEPVAEEPAPEEPTA